MTGAGGPRILAGGWSCAEPEPVDAPGGLTLQYVSLYKQLLSTDARVCRIWIGQVNGRQVKAKPLRLGVAGELAATDTTIRAPAVQNAFIDPPFTPVDGLSVGYAATPTTLGASDGPSLAVTQTYLFTAFGSDPQHEPGGLVKAGRFYPLIDFVLTDNRGKSAPINYIRVDYRIDISIPMFMASTAIGSLIQERGNLTALQVRKISAGAFLDRDGYDPYKSNPFAGLAGPFARAEKPLQFEMLGEGLDWSAPLGKGVWDNLHFWPTDEGLPPTPGAPHAIHVHWRWGTASVKNTVFTPAGGEPQFFGIDHIAGGARVDPRIPCQRLRFAVTAGTVFDSAYPPSWKPDQLGSAAKFGDLFTTARKPLNIANGSPLTLWLSMEAARKPSRDGWAGTFFADGMFFALGDERASPTFSLLRVGGLAHGGIVPPNGTEPGNMLGVAQWWRPAKPGDKPPLLE